MFLLFIKQCLPLMKNSSEVADWFIPVIGVLIIVGLIVLNWLDSKTTSYSQVNLGGCLGLAAVIAILLIFGGLTNMFFTPHC